MFLPVAKLTLIDCGLGLVLFSQPQRFISKKRNPSVLAHPRTRFMIVVPPIQ
jgi:hypothetical protein